MQRVYTAPVKPQSGKPVMAEHMINHARAIEELQRMLGSPNSISNTNITLPRGGNFCTKYKVFVNPTTDIYLVGGVVSGGTGNIDIDDYNLATIGSEPADGTYVWLEVDFTAYVEDGVLLPGGDVTSVITGEGTTLPDNVIPTAAAPDGMLVVPLGLWSNGSFVASDCGNIQVSHCPGSLTHNH